MARSCVPRTPFASGKGERVRFEMSNRTMMHHPMHLHGHFFRVLNGQGANAPLKHTIDVAPMQTTVIEFDANEEKDWFFHCHVLYHMKSGMERIVHYEGTEVDAATLAVRPRLYDDSWYAFGSASVLSQMSQGAAEVSNTRNIFGVGWEVGYEDGDYDVTGSYSYYVNRYLSPFLGVNAYSEADGGEDVRGVFGLSWLLPLNVRTSVWVGTDKSFRWSAGKEITITRRLVGFADTQYDTVTGWGVGFWSRVHRDAPPIAVRTVQLRVRAPGAACGCVSPLPASDRASRHNAAHSSCLRQRVLLVNSVTSSLARLSVGIATVSTYCSSLNSGNEQRIVGVTRSRRAGPANGLEALGRDGFGVALASATW